MVTGRKLSRYELAFLRAVVELGDNASGYAVKRVIGGSTGALYVTATRLEEEGFVRSFDVEGGPERSYRVRRFWRPAFDLTGISETVK